MDFDFKTLLVILVVVLIIFGGKKLRSIGDDLGHAVKGFKKAMSEGDQEETSAPARQIRSEGTDAEFPEKAKTGNGTPAEKSNRNV
jgi:sec-independent protein translocase protein TatA